MNQQATYINDWPQFSTIVREHLHARRREFPKLAEAASVSVRWVRSFSVGEYPGTRPDWVIALAEVLGLKPKLQISLPGVETPREPMPALRGGGKVKPAHRARRVAPRKRGKRRY